MGKKKVVLDTNVLISALGWRGVPHKISLKCLQGEIKNDITPKILQEIKKVIEYPKFKFTHVDKSEFIGQILEAAFIVDGTLTVDEIKNDESDNQFLECAVLASADYIVTGDEHLLGLGEFLGVKILKPKKFWELVKA